MSVSITGLDNLKRAITDVEKNTEEKVRRAQKQALENSAPKVLEKLAPKIKHDLKEIFNFSVTMFYHSYSPIRYKRRASLFNIFDIDFEQKTNGDKTSISIYQKFNGDKVKYREDSGGYDETLFELTYIEGYHGGAKSGFMHPNPGTPYWRTGYEVDDEGRVAYKRWYKPAPKMEESPWDMYLRMNEKWSAKIGKYMNPIFEKIFMDEFSKIIS